MTLLVPVLILAILVLAWIAWLAFGPRSTPVLPSYLMHDRDWVANQAEDDSGGAEFPPLGRSAREAQHVQDRLHASNGSAASLNGNAMHLELRPVLHEYSAADGRRTDFYQA
jgi:hypothetical protein